MIFLATVGLGVGVALIVSVGVGVGVGSTVGVGVGVGVTTGASWNNFTVIVGEEKVKPLAENKSQPFLSTRVVEATFAVPSGATIEISALIGAFENL